MKKMLYIPSSVKDGCYYYRVHLPCRYDPSSYLMWSEDETYFLDEVLKYDAVSFQRLYSSSNHETFYLLRNEGKSKIVYDIDDNVLRISKTHPRYQLFRNNKDLYVKCMNMSDLVTVSTLSLKHALSKVCEVPIRVLPNRLDFNDWKRVDHEDGKYVTIGWVGSRTHLEDMKIISPIIDTLISEYKGKVRFVMVGTDYRELFRETTEYLPWKSYEEYPDYLHSLHFDIGVAPIESNEFNNCKSNIKYLEYSALGIPTVASNFGPYRNSITNELNGFLASSASKWREYLKALIDSVDLRAKIGHEGYCNAKLGYDIKDDLKERTKAFNEVLWE